ncbi:MAG: L-threonylcarbamoyladenylate synthase [Desulfopila sp.]
MKNTDGFSHDVSTAIGQGVAAIRSGGIVAVPTETYYGLAVDPANESAIMGLFALKKRPCHKPILLLISAMNQLDRLVKEIPSQYLSLMERFWPGPLTLIFPAQDQISPLLTGGSGTIGVRLTSHPVARRIIDQLGSAITATSANLSAREPARSAARIREVFGDRIDVVVDVGPADDGPGSTVVNLQSGRLCVERQGRIALPAVPACRQLR